MIFHSKALIFILALFSVLAYAAPRQSPFVTKTARNDGDSRSGFRVSVGTAAWVEVLSSDVRRRYAVFYGTGTAMLEICLSTVSASGTTCLANTDGRHMPTIGVLIEDYSEAALYARGLANGVLTSSSPVILNGEYQYDSADSSSFQ